MVGWEYHSVPPTFCHSGFKGCILALPQLHEIQSVRLVERHEINAMLLWALLESADVLSDPRA